jgi:hypothetical protein
VKAIAISISIANLDWFASREIRTSTYLVAVEEKVIIRERITVWILLIYYQYKAMKEHHQTPHQTPNYHLENVKEIATPMLTVDRASGAFKETTLIQSPPAALRPLGLIIAAQTTVQKITVRP